MTAKKDFKRRVRERMAKTGESYTAARARVAAAAPAAGDAPAKPKPFDVVEFMDETAVAKQLGLRCEVLVSASMVERIAPARVLERLRDALLLTESDPQMEPFRALVFRGEGPRERRLSRIRWEERWEHTKVFFARLRAGIGGVHEAGHLLAFSVDGVMVIAHATCVPRMPPIVRPMPRLFLDSADAFLAEDSGHGVLPR